MSIEITVHTNDVRSEVLRFSIRNVDVSIINGLRRVIINDIPSFGCYQKCTFVKNTSKLTNEVLKNRIHCIPAHCPMNFPLDEYKMVLHVKNDKDTIQTVTTEHITIQHIESGELLSDDQTRAIFPPNPITHHFIDIVRLRPTIKPIYGETIEGEELHVMCEFEKVTPSLHSAFNVQSTCAYGNTVDTQRQPSELAKKVQEWKQEGKGEDEIAQETKNWYLLEGKRTYIPNSFEFVLETVGVYTNYELVVIASTILMQMCDELVEQLTTNTLQITRSSTTLTNGYDITLPSGNSTLGQLITNWLYNTQYQKSLTFCGYCKFHPHDTHGCIRIAFSSSLDTIETVHALLQTAATSIRDQYSTIAAFFSK